MWFLCFIDYDILINVKYLFIVIHILLLMMSSRPQKPALRDFLIMHSDTRKVLCSREGVFDPCTKLLSLTSFEKATLTSWCLDSNIDKGVNLYILLHFLSSINKNSYYFHYVNNGSSDGTNMFGHIIGTSGM